MEDENFKTGEYFLISRRFSSSVDLAIGLACSREDAEYFTNKEKEANSGAEFRIRKIPIWRRSV
jgi:hypothetical protein